MDLHHRAPRRRLSSRSLDTYRALPILQIPPRSPHPRRRLRLPLALLLPRRRRTDHPTLLATLVQRPARREIQMTQVIDTTTSPAPATHEQHALPKLPQRFIVFLAEGQEACGCLTIRHLQDRQSPECCRVSQHHRRLDVGTSASCPRGGPCNDASAPFALLRTKPKISKKMGGKS